jgi:hypothetical protein
VGGGLSYRNGRMERKEVPQVKYPERVLFWAGYVGLFSSWLYMMISGWNR